MRQWGTDVPIIAGGPYATSDFTFLLQDTNIDLAVLGEGELILGNLVEKMMENNKKLPPEEILKTIPGIALAGKKTKIQQKQKNREIILMDETLGLVLCNLYLRFHRQTQRRHAGTSEPCQSFKMGGAIYQPGLQFRITVCNHRL
jgi:hypothetical protein